MYRECYEIILPPNFRALGIQQFNDSMRVASHVLVAGGEGMGGCKSLLVGASLPPVGQSWVNIHFQNR